MRYQDMNKMVEEFKSLLNSSRLPIIRLVTFKDGKIFDIREVDRTKFHSAMAALTDIMRYELDIPGVRHELSLEKRTCY